MQRMVVDRAATRGAAPQRAGQQADARTQLRIGPGPRRHRGAEHGQDLAPHRKARGMAVRRTGARRTAGKRGGYPVPHRRTGELRRHELGRPAQGLRDPGPSLARHPAIEPGEGLRVGKRDIPRRRRRGAHAVDAMVDQGDLAMIGKMRPVVPRGDEGGQRRPSAAAARPLREITGEGGELREGRVDPQHLQPRRRQRRRDPVERHRDDTGGHAEPLGHRDRRDRERAAGAGDRQGSEACGHLDHRALEFPRRPLLGPGAGAVLGPIDLGRRPP
jgi:hypothetical protein